MDVFISQLIQASPWTSSEHGDQWENSNFSANAMSFVKLMIVNIGKQVLSSG